MYEKAKIVTRGMLDLVMVLAGCEGNDNRLRIWERVVKYMVCHSGSRHLHQRLLPTMHQFFESAR